MMKHIIACLCMLFAPLFSISSLAQSIDAPTTQQTDAADETAPQVVAAFEPGGGEERPSTPTSAPVIIGGNTQPINTNYTVRSYYVNTGYSYYQLFESSNNSNYSMVYQGSNRDKVRSHSSPGYRYYKYKTCNLMGCSVGFSPYVRVTLTGTSNTPPVANTDSINTTGSTVTTYNVLTNDNDADGDSMSVVSHTPANKGSVSCQSNGNCTYTAPTSVPSATTAQFSYTVSDGVATSTATVNIAISAAVNVNQRRVIFVHTDLLGSPAAESQGGN